MAKRPTRKKRRIPKRRKTSSRKRRKSSIKWLTLPKYWKRWLLILFAIFVVYIIYLDFTITNQFEGKRWALPAHVFARPLELYLGKKLTMHQFDQEIRMLHYRNVFRPKQAGSYQKSANTYRIYTRNFSFWDGNESSRLLDIRFSNNQISELREVKTNTLLSLLRLEPVFIGGIYPAHHEDRLLIKLEDVPNFLHSALVMMEDKKFYQHHGVDPLAILRALWANIRAGKTVQGGSTLTQQLVKNFFLNNKRTLWRKVNEAIMSLLLELHYSKKEIMQAYMNEIYLGQDGKRAIHGLGLASRFYFDKSVSELDLPEMALLIALVRGPHYYNPTRWPKRAIARRNRVLDLMASNKLISSATAKYAKQTELGIVQTHAKGITAYPAFMDLVKRQLRGLYKESDLRSEGLQIFTTLDPVIQSKAENSLDKQINILQARVNKPAALQGAVVVSNTTSGEVLALVGDRNTTYAGFNRALDAVRPVGSLIKPAVYLAAIEDKENYSLITPIDDKPITLQAKNGTTWTPKNYDGKSHGIIPLYEGLAHSYNQATVRLGMLIGLERVVNTMKKLGISKDIKPYPSIMLGTISLTPYEVAQVYQTIAAGGFKSPLRAIREVMTSQGEPLERFPINVQQTVSSASTKILQSALQQVVTTGTGRSVYQWLDRSIIVAGKTGTTNDLRDSWFAGFSKTHNAVVWLGKDDNSPTGLTGASGALPVWAKLMQAIKTNSLENKNTGEIEYLDINENTLLLTRDGCEQSVKLAFIKGSGPNNYSECEGNNVISRSINWFKRVFQ